MSRREEMNADCSQRALLSGLQAIQTWQCRGPRWQEPGIPNTDGRVFLACSIDHLIYVVSKGHEMLDYGNLQLVRGADSYDTFADEMKAINDVGTNPSDPTLKFLTSIEQAVGRPYPEEDLSRPRILLECILDLSKLLAEDTGGRLSLKQIDYAQTIYTAGTQLLALVDRQLLDNLDGEDFHQGFRSRRSDDDLALTTRNITTSFDRGRHIPGLERKRVLIVDDEVLSIYAMTGALEQQGMIVLHADSATAGLEMLRLHRDIDAVIVNGDMQTPGGHELIATMRASSGLRSIPVIAVVSGNENGERDICMGVGASDYIEKPINVEQLLSIVRAWLTCP